MRPFGLNYALYARSIAGDTPAVTYLLEDSEARASGENIDVSNTITPTAPSDDTVWSIIHNVTGNVRVRPTDINWPATGFGAAGTAKGFEHNRGSLGGWTSYMANQTSKPIKRMKARVWFTNSTTYSRSAGLTITANNNSFSAREHVNISLLANAASNAWAFRISEIVSNTSNVRSTVNLSNTAGEMVFDIEVSTTDYQTYTATARQYNMSGTLLADETITWDAGSNVYKGGYKNVIISGNRYDAVFDFVEGVSK